MNVQIIRSKRRTISIQIKPDGSVQVRAPLRATNRDIERLLVEKQDWINKHVEEALSREERRQQTPKLTPEELKILVEDASIYIPERVRVYAPVIGVDYSRITIRCQKTRWGSCSAKGGLNFNCLLMKMPVDIIDYVVVHELCHRKEMNHSKAFWAEVEKVLPDYKNRRKWLRVHGDEYMKLIY